MSSVRVTINANRLLRQLDKLAPAARSSLVEFITAFTVRLSDQVKVNIAALFRSRGPLYDSVGYQVNETPTQIAGRVFTQNIPYARIQEEGGTTRPHTIVPRTANVLAFEGPAGLVFAKRVNHPGSRIPARPYASLALTQMRGEYEAGIREVVSKAIGEMKA